MLNNLFVNDEIDYTNPFGFYDHCLFNDKKKPFSLKKLYKWELDTNYSSLKKKNDIIKKGDWINSIDVLVPINDENFNYFFNLIFEEINFLDNLPYDERIVNNFPESVFNILIKDKNQRNLSLFTEIDYLIKFGNIKYWNEKDYVWFFYGPLFDIFYILNSYSMQSNLEIEQVTILHTFFKDKETCGKLNKFEHKLDLPIKILPFLNFWTFFEILCGLDFIEFEKKSFKEKNFLKEKNFFFQLKKKINENDFENFNKNYISFRIVFKKSSLFFKKKNVINLLTYTPLYWIDKNLFFVVYKQHFNFFRKTLL